MCKVYSSIGYDPSYLSISHILSIHHIFHVIRPYCNERTPFLAYKYDVNSTCPICARDPVQRLRSLPLSRLSVSGWHFTLPMFHQQKPPAPLPPSVLVQPRP